MKLGQSTHDFLKAAGDSKRLFKEYLAAVEPVKKGDAVAPRTYRFTITTSNVDRQRDTIATDGWKLDGYLKNPVVLWAHDYSQPPVAVARTLERTSGGLVSEAEFVDASIYPFAGVVEALVRMGALSATSVGFQPIKWAYNEERRGVDFVEQELLEYSIVPVPANADCLIEARAAGVDVEPLREWAARVQEKFGVARLPELAQIALTVGGKTVYSFAPDPAVAAAVPAEEPAGTPAQPAAAVKDAVLLGAAPDARIADAVRLNAEGAELLAAGRYEEAAAVIDAAADLLEDFTDSGDDAMKAATVATKVAEEERPAEEVVKTALGDLVLESLEEFDLDAIEAEVDEIAGITAADIAAALRTAIVEGVTETVARRIALARGRVD